MSRTYSTAWFSRKIGMVPPVVAPARHSTYRSPHAAAAAAGAVRAPPPGPVTGQRDLGRDVRHRGPHLAAVAGRGGLARLRGGRPGRLGAGHGGGRRLRRLDGQRRPDPGPAGGGRAGPAAVPQPAPAAAGRAGPDHPRPGPGLPAGRDRPGPLPAPGRGQAAGQRVRARRPRPGRDPGGPGAARRHAGGGAGPRGRPPPPPAPPGHHPRLLGALPRITRWLAKIFNRLSDRTGGLAGGRAPDGALGMLVLLAVLGVLVVAGSVLVVGLGLLWLPLALLVRLARVLAATLSRAGEHAADRHAAELGYGPRLVQVLRL